ncbi:MAG: hypothetical protein AUK35_05310 [Zetaproteobacteria bacterium CG2_30_46_52]|nr:MAG: hypothetical protein AUK35_05310 [Zetaproteobacteria bacterium CG2_30_46_52]
MAIKRVYFREDNFVLTMIYGKLTNAEINAHVIAMNKENAKVTGLMELADCRYLTDTSELNSENLMVAASMERGQSRAIGGKGAIVAISDMVYALARVYAAIASDIREDSQVFRDINLAIAFLGIEHLKDEVLLLADDVQSH